jgi:hypothetical protein
MRKVPATLRRMDRNRVAPVVLAALAVAASLAGCSCINKSMAAWEGRSANDLIADWGPPQQIMSDGNGGRILVYTTHTLWGGDTAQTNGNITSYGAISATTTYQPSGSYRMFWVNSSGVIYRWTWRGL